MPVTPSLLERLVAALPTRLPNAAWRRGEDGRSLVFPAASEDFGDLVVSGDPHAPELVVDFGRFTHGHFDCHEDGLSADARDGIIVARVLDCLDDVFADRLEFYGSHAGFGGSRPRGTQGRLSKFLIGDQAFVWSGRRDAADG